MKKTSFFILTLTGAVLFSLIGSSPVFSKGLTTHQKLLRQEAQYLTLLEQSPDEIDSRLKLAQLYSRKNNYSKAALHFNKALSSGSQLPAIYVGLAFNQQQAGNIDEAIQTCQQGITANPDNAELHLRLGNLYHAKGLNEKAEGEYLLHRQLNTDL